MTGPNQHFVPQYYLKTFSNDNKVFVFDKQKDKYLSDQSISVDKIAFSKDFYKIDPNDLSEFLISETYDWTYVDSLLEKHNEKISAPLINSFIDLGEQVYKEKDIEIISVIRTDDIIDFLIVQLFRTPFFRKQFELIAEEIHKKNKDNTELIKKKPIEKLASTIHGVYIISAICNTQIWKNEEKKHLIKPEFRFIDIEIIDKIDQLKKKNKTLWVSSLDSYFVTSDNPIYVEQTDSGSIQMLFFPLTKRCAITFWDADFEDKSVIIINDHRRDVLRTKNEMMKKWAYRFIYSHTKE